VSGADRIDIRPGFSALLARIAGNGVRTVIVETASRFARDLMVQEVGFAMLRDLGVTLIAADSPTSFLDDGPTSKLVRQILGAVAGFDKAMVVAKLKGARDRIHRTKGKCEGRKSYAEREGGHELIDMTRWLRSNERIERGKRIDGRPYSLRKVAAELARYGYVTPSGRPYAAAAIASMLAT
jgi:DNA invertase Pin-like site-specific DNA recombinase